MTTSLALLGGTPIRSHPFPSWPVFDASDEARVLATVRSGKWGKLDGEEVAQFEQNFARMHGCKHGIAVVNGTVSLRLALLAAGLDPAAEVLKVAHHGSRTSSTAPFLDRVGARIAIISAGSPSPFGHPHPEVLDRLDQRGVRVYRTSACGAITLSTDGKDLSVETTVPCHPTP